MDEYLLTILGSSADYFYEADSYPVEGDFSHGRYAGMFAGGCPLNVGAVCASKGIRVKALDMLGKDDETTPFLLDELKKFNIDTENVIIQKDVANGKVVIIVTGDKRTMFVIDPIRPTYVIDDRIQDLLNDAKYIYSLMHMINRSFDDISPLLEAKRHGAKIVLDGTSKYDDPSRIKILYSLADCLFINETDYQRLSEHSEKDPKDIIFSNGGEFIVVTRGSEGSTLYLKDREIYKPSMKNIDIIDSTGAGDAFAGCFLACLMSGYGYEKALRMATINGAYACTIFGGQGGVASFDTLETFTKENNYDL